MMLKLQWCRGPHGGWVTGSMSIPSINKDFIIIVFNSDLNWNLSWPSWCPWGGDTIDMEPVWGKSCLWLLILIMVQAAASVPPWPDLRLQHGEWAWIKSMNEGVFLRSALKTYSGTLYSTLWQTGKTVLPWSRCKEKWWRCNSERRVQ